MSTQIRKNDIAPGVVSKIGTSFPGSPPTNDRLYRSDLAQEFYYDGTTWLSTQIHSVSFSEIAGFTNSGSHVVVRQPVPYLSGGADLWLVSAVFTTFVQTTNDGSNYWTIDLSKRNASGTATVIASRTTASDTVDNWVRGEVSIAALLGGVSTYRGLDLNVVNTGSPGSIFPSATLHYRIVAA